eukprot:GILJ01012057.1.p1 GENE.GILJ01012057.1~~GILJ01012057.1.p1  ORF type:complete len:938 (+),score=126.51 GILJ01012057.1:75-2888(+)
MRTQNLSRKEHMQTRKTKEGLCVYVYVYPSCLFNLDGRACADICAGLPHTHSPRHVYNIVFFFSAQAAAFSSLCELLQCISSNRSARQGSLVSSAVGAFLSTHGRLGLYAFIRLLLPEQDHARRYGMQQTRLCEHLLQIFAWRDSKRGQEVKQWRTNSSEHRGDLSMAVYNALLQEGAVTSSTLTIGQVNVYLDGLGCLLSPSSDHSFAPPKGQHELLRTLFTSVSALESKWLVRIILKDLRIGSKSVSIFNGVSEHMVHIAKYRSSLPDLCHAVEVGSLAGSTVAGSMFHLAARCLPRPGSFIAPMLASRSSVNDVINRLTGETVHIETKYDGFRCMVHFDRHKPLRQVENDSRGTKELNQLPVDSEIDFCHVQVFSRPGKDHTEERRSLLPYLLQALGFYAPNQVDVDSTVSIFPIHDAILDGELLVYNRISNQIEPFGTIQTLSSRKDESLQLSGQRHYVVKFFDILYLNGRNLLCTPLTERRRLLENILRPIQHRVELVHSIRTILDPVEFKKLYVEAIHGRLEGLMVKRADSLYLPCERTGWHKVKRDYIEGLADTLDMCIVGAKFGLNRSGRRTDLPEILVVAALSNKNQFQVDLSQGSASAVTPRFEALFDVEMWKGEFNLKRFIHRIQPLCDVCTEKGSVNRPLWLTYAPSYKRSHLDWIIRDPMHAPVVEILGSGFVYSEGDLVVRFPRICKERFELKVPQCICVDEFYSMAELSIQSPSIDELNQIAVQLQTKSNQRQRNLKRSAAAAANAPAAGPAKRQTGAEAGNAVSEAIETEPIVVDLTSDSLSGSQMSKETAEARWKRLCCAAMDFGSAVIYLDDSSMSPAEYHRASTSLKRLGCEPVLQITVNTTIIVTNFRLHSNLKLANARLQELNQLIRNLKPMLPFRDVCVFDLPIIGLWMELRPVHELNHISNRLKDLCLCSTVFT